MKFVSVDLETTGLLPDKHQILEIGMVVADFSPDQEYIAAKRWLKRWEHIEGHPFALNMNAALIKEIAESNADPAAGIFDNWRDLFDDVYAWLMEHGFTKRSDERVAFTAAGKNYNGFDRQFLERIPEWNQRFVVAHRCFDPTSLFYRDGDTKLPDLATCCKRAGVSGRVEHQGVADALMVVKCLRAFYKRE